MLPLRVARQSRAQGPPSLIPLSEDRTRTTASGTRNEVGQRTGRFGTMVAQVVQALQHYVLCKYSFIQS